MNPEAGEGKIISLNLKFGRVTYLVRDITRSVAFTALTWNEERGVWVIN